MPPKKPPEPRPEPPANLSESAQALWRAVVLTAIPPGRAVLIETALLAHDRARDAAVIIEREGLTTTTGTTGAVHVHPAAKVEREFASLFGRLWQQLGLDRDQSRGW
jgi:phage terminase small subunit